ncbi:MAG: galactokinase [Treponema sp.]|jgi:galactokinase|nr:galactokinase [Treponema sp.]
MTAQELEALFQGPEGDAVFTALYGDKGRDAARERYMGLAAQIRDPKAFPPGDFPECAGGIRVFSAPGRTELGGNHTDHNRGKVLAASIQLDAAALAAPRQDKRVFFRSSGHPDVSVDLSRLDPQSGEEGTSEALVRGIAAQFAARGLPVRGFTAVASSTVLTGSGLSSSAALEALVGRVFDSLFGKGTLSAVEIAQIGQKAENVYFGKPCGLMDQVACALGGVAAIDFEDPKNPLVRKIAFDPNAAGYTLCVVNTRGSHADLTPDYAAVPFEMRGVAAFFGKTELRDLDADAVIGAAAALRKAVGDRAVIRALHFFGENRRVEAMEQRLLEAAEVGRSAADKRDAMAAFLALVNESGDSSWELLQDVYSPRDPANQGLSLALALTQDFLDREARGGACRVHGGGFAGTIQAYIPAPALERYRALIDRVFGEGAVTELRIRPLGAVELFVCPLACSKTVR